MYVKHVKSLKKMTKHNFLLLIIITSSLMLLSFATKSRTYQTECISLESDGYIAI
jgi:hypothetical protein